jgi:hypothetical protein
MNSSTESASCLSECGGPSWQAASAGTFGSSQAPLASTGAVRLSALIIQLLSSWAASGGARAAAGRGRGGGGGGQVPEFAIDVEDDVRGPPGQEGRGRPRQVVLPLPDGAKARTWRSRWSVR